jgi:hypothetical protein
MKFLSPFCIPNYVVSSPIDKTKKIRDSKEKTEVQNDILNGGHYPNQYYVCGYPQQLVTDYNSFEKVNCN